MPVAVGIIKSSPLPCTAHIALAVAIIKSKPANMTIDEYLDRLHEHVDHNRHDRILPHQPFFNATAFWESAYRKLSSENALLMRRIYRLEEQSSGHENAPTSMQISSSPERKTANSSLADVGISWKRKRVDHMVTNDREAEPVITTLDQPNVPLSLHTAARLLHQCLETPNPRPAVIEKYNVAVCQIVHRLLDNMDNHTKHDAPLSDQSDNRHDIPSLSIAIRKIYPLLLRAVTIYQQSDAYEPVKLSCINNIACLYRSVLNLLSRIRECRLPDEQSRHTTEQGDNGRRPKDETDQAFVALTTTATMMLTTCDMKQEVHRSLFDAIFYVLLDHLGLVTSTLTFGNISDSAIPSFAVQPPKQLPEPPSRSSLLCLLQILQATIKTRAEGGNPSGIGHVGLEKSGSDVRIQNTLLCGIFGKEDMAFQETLSQPALPSTVHLDEILTMGTGDMSTAEWFVGQVWEEIGWEVLAR